jgi:DNA-binding CsgD family transcriptional regulator/PAS domain-containing protein
VTKATRTTRAAPPKESDAAAASVAAAPEPLPLALSFDQFSELVGKIYEGPLEDVPWASAMRQIRLHLDANWVTLILRPASTTQQAILVRASARGEDLYGAAYNHFQVFSLDPFVGLPADKVLAIDEMIDTRQWTQGEFYRQFIEPNHIRYIIGADIPIEGGGECRLRITRPPGAQDFSEHDKAFCQHLLPHLRRSVKLRSRVEGIESERRLYAVAMDRMQIGTVVLNEQGMIIRSNGVADSILAEKDGIEVAKGRLHAEYALEDRELQRLIKIGLASNSRTAPAVAEAISLTRPSGQPKLGVLVRSIPCNELSEGNDWQQVAVFIRDPRHQPHPSHELVRRLFGFTSAEVALALLLTNGLTLDEAAVELNIRKNTARAHLRSIFSKTGVTRQTMLVRLLLNSVASVS